MKKLKITLLAITLTTFCFSQQLSRNVISSGGNYYTAGGYSNSSTIGESMVTTLTSASNILTQGFQQSFSNPVDPTITIINPLNGDVFLNNNNIGIDFSITDFVVAAGTGDGHIHYYVNGAMTMKYDTLPITLNGLTNGSYQIIIELVDNSHQGFSPTIADTVNFSVNVIYGCTDPTAFNFNPTATADDGSCIPFVYGCTDPVAVNYNSTVNSDDGSCFYPCLLDNVTLIMTDSYGDGWNANSITINGADYGLADVNGDFNTSNVFTTYSGGYEDSVILCLDLSTCIDVTYNPTGAYQNENAWVITDGYGSVLASGDNTTPIVSFGTCAVYGCTDPLATNHDSNATEDDGSCLYSGCTDPLASNYDANATIDDGSCSYGPSLCAGSAITGLSVSDIIHDRATFNFDNMNTYDATGAQVCRVDQIRIKYRPVGTSSWSQKNMAQPTGYDAVTGICNSTQNTAKITRNLMSSTTYEWEVKVWYCDGQNSGFVAGPNFTTLDDCPNVGNLTAYGATPTKATFAWDNSNGAYSFVRLKARVDSISNPTGSDFFQIGGAGVSYGIYTKNKQNMVPGETYRGQARTYCDPNGGPYRSPSWSPLVFWTQPTVRIEGGISIANLDVYPNPSRDVFNVAFTSEDVQDLEVRVINVVGEVVYTESLQQFVGEYTKLIDLSENTKGVYFLEITTNTGVVNKKLVLQ